MSALARYFDFTARRTTLARELRGGLATFLTMAYILLANPDILSAAPGAGVAMKASFLSCTAIAAGVCCIGMGLYANFPLALASGMGLNAVVAFTVATQTGSWRAAMGLIVLDGLLILALVLLGLREAVMEAIPRELRLAIGAGIGLFIAFIGLKNAGLVKADPNTLVTFGALTTPDVWVALVGLFITAMLLVLRIPGALVIGIAVATSVALAFKVTTFPHGGLLSLPDLSAAFHPDVRAVLHWKFVPLLLSVTMVDFFDTLGTATAVAEAAGLIDERTGRIPGLRRILIVDSLSASLGGLMGASSVTSYIESASGVAEGARTGLHSVVVGLLFLLAAFAAPLATPVPPQAVAPALILVGFLMLAPVTRIDFDQPATAIPAFITILTIPLTFSIAHGIGYGLVAYVVIQMLTLRFRTVHPLMYVVAGAFVAYFFLA
jgi:AGZA family xanthine/uracil permease-like MFS transporter